MNTEDARYQKDRLEKYDKLQALYEKSSEALSKVVENDPAGPCGQGPFTSNTRESRSVDAIRIWFTSTQGRSPAVELTISHLDISASALGRFLESELRSKMKQLHERIEAL